MNLTQTKNNTLLFVKFFFTIQLITSCLHLPAIKLLIKEELKNKSGIYVFICNITGHMYIGSAKNLSKRISEHLSGHRSNVPLQRGFTKYGLDNFTLVILEFSKPKDLIAREQYYIDLLNPI